MWLLVYLSVAVCLCPLLWTLVCWFPLNALKQTFCRSDAVHDTQCTKGICGMDSDNLFKKSVDRIRVFAMMLMTMMVVVTTMVMTLNCRWITAAIACWCPKTILPSTCQPWVLLTQSKNTLLRTRMNCLLRCVFSPHFCAFDIIVHQFGKKNPVLGLQVLWKFIVSPCIASRPSDHYFRSVCWFVCLFVCAESFSAVFDPISIKLGHMLYVWV